MDYTKLNLSERKIFFRNHISTWKKSNLSQAKYCKQNNLKITTFIDWKNRFDSKSLEKFIELPHDKIQKTIKSEGLIELKIKNLFTIKITRPFDANLLKEILVVLGVS